MSRRVVMHLLLGTPSPTRLGITEGFFKPFVFKDEDFHSLVVDKP